jgi:ketosteroid isomerase-like protein
MYMKVFMKMMAVALLVLLNCWQASAQAPSPTQETSQLVLEQGVSPHKGLDEVYRRFSEGYKKLDAPSVANLYSETAAYLAPGSNVEIGRPKVLENFSRFFDSVKRRNGRMEISFRIVQRQVDNNLAYDVGVFTLTSFNERGEPRTSSGKFVVVAKREKNGTWLFQVDGYNDLPK